ncbi:MULTISPECIES: ABC transporter permease [unclassified Lebetimonas]|uniref:ABC transporter permease n=1 Tax=unclassified Lebetimonas TaxID=2648158 RepID=UPI00046505AB|nr:MULTISPECIES: ABC transporter permease [unclassified Lebetimonas]
MNFGVIRAYILNEFKDLIRSKMIFMVYLVPLMILILFGYGIKMDVKHARSVVIDYDKSKISLELISKMKNSQYFKLLPKMSEKEALKQMKTGKVDMIFIIPPSFEKNILKNQKTGIGVFIDGAYPMRALTMQSYAEGLILDIAKRLKPGLKSLISINQRMLFNQSLRDANAIVPGLLGLILLVAPAILAALLIVKEKEEGTIFNFYSSPVGKIDFLISKLTPVFFLHSFNIFNLFLVAVYIFKVPFKGNFLIYFFSSEIYILISLGIGLLVSIVSSRQIVALVLTIIITIIPGFLYSGMLMPISSMKGESYIEAHLFPVMYYNHLVSDTFLIGQGFGSSKNILYFCILIVYAVVLLILGRLFLKKGLK